MKQAILITIDILTLDELAKTASNFCEYKIVSDTQFNVFFDGDNSHEYHLSVSLFDRIETFLDEVEKKQIGAIYPHGRHYFVIEFKSYSTFKRFILQLYIFFDFIIDNDFGYFYGRDEFSTKNTYEEFIEQRSALFLE